MKSRRSQRTWIKAIALGFSSLVLAALFLGVQPLPVANAATFNIADGDVTALKAALTAPNPPHTINLANNGTYTLNSVDNSNTYGSNGLPTIDRNITINGNGATITRALGGAIPQFRIFYIVSTGNLTLNNLSITNGNDNSAYGGGAIFNQGGTLSINNSYLATNTTLLGGGAIANVGKGDNGSSAGAGASFTATLTVNNSTFNTNVAGGFGGGAIYNAAAGGNADGNGHAGGSGSAITNVTNSTFLLNQAVSNSAGGAIFSGAQNGTNSAATATVNVSNSTFSSNQATNGAGGGIINLNLGSAGVTNVFADLMVTNATFFNNTSGSSGGGGIANGTILVNGPAANTTFRNTLFSSNAGGNCFNIGAPFIGNNNLEYTGSAGSTTCGTGSTFTQTNPLSGGLANNGGPTGTIALSSNSPAIDAGDNAICAAAPVNNLDQRGVSRPIGPACDIGAFEAPSACSPTTVVSSNLDNGTCGTLRSVLSAATTGTTITFNLTTPVTIQLSGSGLNISAGVSIQGTLCNAGPSLITIDGTNVSGAVLTLNGGNTTITGLKIKETIHSGIHAFKGGNKLKCIIVSH